MAEVAEAIADRVGNVPAQVDDALARLDPVFEQTRYPSGDAEKPIPADLIGEGEAVSSVEKAEEIVSWVRELLQLPPPVGQ